MVGKPAAGEKKRGRPRKKGKGRPPLPASSAPAAARREVAPPPPPPPPPPPARRSHRPRRPPRMDDYADYGDEDDDFFYGQLFTDEEAAMEEVEDDEEEESDGAQRSRREKKFKLLQKLPNYHHHQRRSAPPSSSSSSEDDDCAGGRKTLEKGSTGTGRRGGDEEEEDGREVRRDGSGSGGEDEEDGGRHAVPKGDHSASGTTMDQCRMATPLPDKKMLEAVLDKLQKKDIYGVYAEPVDPEELPDYHDIIKHPMDFGTIRKKLVTGVYCNLEQIESDVFLLCTNAMQYNAPDTIYFRQAHSIQELARKKFQIIRFNSQDALRSDQKTQTNSMTGKSRKRSLHQGIHISGGSDISLAGTCISTDDACGAGCNAEQACPIEQPDSVNGFIDGNLTCENKSEKGSERGDEHSARSSPIKLERKPDTLYEDRRTTYDLSNEQPVIQSDSLFTTFENEQKHLVAVGLDTEFSYARSLARFAGTLGPIAWGIATEKIEKALPTGIKFGCGWVGEYEPLPTPVLSIESQSGYNTHFPCKTEYQKEMAKKDDMKHAKSVATKGLQLDARVPSDPSIMGVTNGKANHLGLSFCHGSPDPNSRPFGFNNGAQPAVVNTMLPQCKPLDVASAKDIATNISSFKSKSVVNMAPQRNEQCSEVATSRVLEMSSNTGNSKRPGICKKPEVVSYQSERTSLSMDNKSLSSGKSVENFGDNGRQIIYSGFIPTNQAGVLGNRFSHGGREQAVGDPVELMRSMRGRKMVDDNPRQLMSAVPLPGSNSIAAVPTAAPVWMSVGRSSKQKMTEASDHLKMQEEAASVVNLPSEALASVSGFHGNNQKRTIASVPQLPIQAVGEEHWVQSKGLSGFPQFIANELSRSHGQTRWRGLAPHLQNQKKDMCPPDLNITFHAPKSPVLQSSGILADSQQPDLALQL